MTELTTIPSCIRTAYSECFRFCVVVPLVFPMMLSVLLPPALYFYTTTTLLLAFFVVVSYRRLQLLIPPPTATATTSSHNKTLTPPLLPLVPELYFSFSTQLESLHYLCELLMKESLRQISSAMRSVRKNSVMEFTWLRVVLMGLWVLECGASLLQPLAPQASPKGFML